jgi:hypothetical protein
MTSSTSVTRILAFDFDLCVCDGEGFFELFTQLLDIYEFTRLHSLSDRGGLTLTNSDIPDSFVTCVEKTYKQLVLEAVAATKKKELFLFRPGLEVAFQAAQQMKKQGNIQYIMFYSNNTCPEFLSFVELIVRLSFPALFSPKMPVVELVFTANTSSRMRVEYAPANQPNAREKSKRGIITCLEDLNLPVSVNPEILFFDDMLHPGFGTSLKLVPEYHALHSAEQIYNVFFGTLEKTGFYSNGQLAPKWRNLKVQNGLMKNSASAFKSFLQGRDLPATFDPIMVENEKAISNQMAKEIYSFCQFNPPSVTTSSRRRRRKTRTNKNS